MPDPTEAADDHGDSGAGGGPRRPVRWWRGRTKRVRLWIVAAIGVPPLVVVVVVAGWLLETTLAGDASAHNVTVLGEPVGGLPPDRLATAVQAIAVDHARTPVEIVTPNARLETTTGALGITVDVEATAEAVRRIGRSEPLWERPWQWLSHLTGSTVAPVHYEIDRTLLAHEVTPLVEQNRIDAVEPTIVATDDGWAPLDGSSGQVLDLDRLVADLAARLDDRPHGLTVDSDPVEVATRFALADAEALATEADRLTGAPLEVDLAAHPAEASPAVLRGFYRPAVGEDALRLDPIPTAVDAWLADEFGGLRRDPVDARFVMGFGPVVEPSRNGRVCCATGTADAVFAALDREVSSLTVDFEVLAPTLSTDDAKGLGITEVVGEFRTTHACCQGRVANIHRIADIVQGAVILPGDTFSLNGFVGPRTEEKGFVAAGAIFNGVFVEDVGGGISQFATTLFNAAFFAGLDYGEYQAHTIYISRYPYGREATISHPSPDLQIVNDSPYGVVIWPTYTGSSITVTLWSTRWATGEQTGQETERIANDCTRVTTERTRVFESVEEAERIRGFPVEIDEDDPDPPDPRAVVDTVFAVYQPGEGSVC